MAQFTHVSIPAEAIDNRLRGRVYGGGVGQVERVDERLPATPPDLFGRRGERLLVARDERHARAPLRWMRRSPGRSVSRSLLPPLLRSPLTGTTRWSRHCYDDLKGDVPVTVEI